MQAFDITFVFNGKNFSILNQYKFVLIFVLNMINITVSVFRSVVLLDFNFHYCSLFRLHAGHP